MSSAMCICLWCGSAIVMREEADRTDINYFETLQLQAVNMDSEAFLILFGEFNRNFSESAFYA